MKELDQWWRIGGECAIGFIILGVIALILQFDVPLPTDPASEIRTYFADHGDRYMIGDVFWLLAFVLGFLPWSAAFTAYLGMAEGEPRPWSRVAFGFAVALVASSAAFGMVGGGLAYSSAQITDDSTLTSLAAMVYYGETFIGTSLSIGLALFSSFVILRTGVLWRWLGWFGMVLAVASFVSVFAVFDDDPEGPLGIFGFLLFIAYPAWILASGIALLTRSGPPAPSSSTG